MRFKILGLNNGKIKYLNYKVNSAKEMNTQMCVFLNVQNKIKTKTMRFGSFWNHMKTIHIKG